jgi:hypothetical protein
MVSDELKLLLKERDALRQKIKNGESIPRDKFFIATSVPCECCSKLIWFMLPGWGWTCMECAKEQGFGKAISMKD